MFENHFIQVRDATQDDIPFYASMLRDREWMDKSGFSLDDFLTDEKILWFVSLHKPWDVKWVVINNSDKTPLGFCHFKQIEDNRAETAGGIIKSKMNTAVSIKSYAQCIDWYFHLNLCQELLSVIYEKNARSLKMNLSLGFKIVGERYYDIRRFHQLALLKEDFYQSNVTKRLLRNR